MHFINFVFQYQFYASVLRLPATGNFNQVTYLILIPVWEYETDWKWFVSSGMRTFIPDERMQKL